MFILPRKCILSFVCWLIVVVQGVNYVGSVSSSGYDDKMDVDRRLQDFGQRVGRFDMQTNQSPDGPDLTGIFHRVKIALSLYKVQQNIYLLDFQRLDVSIHY